MTLREFKYMEYVIIIDVGNWRLKKDAPEHVREAFREWKKQLNMLILR